MSKSKITLSEEQVQLVKSILTNHLPRNTLIWLFGSRATGTAKKFSDIDLLIDANRKPMSLELRANLANAFEESDLPYKVDVVDVVTVDAEFAKIINAEKVLFLIIE